MVAYRLKLHGLSDHIKEFISQGLLTETHLIEITSLSINLYLSPWLTTEQQRISNYISDIRARQRAGRDSKIIRLARLEWTIREIADVIEGIEKSQVHEILSDSTKFGEIGQMLSEGRPIRPFLPAHVG